MTRKLLPIEPTEEMILAGYTAGAGSSSEAKEIWVAMVAAYGKKSKGQKCTLDSFLEACKESGEPAISQYQPVLKYAESVGLPPAYLNLAWQRFKDQYVGTTKRQIDWRKSFLNSVKGGWFRLWYVLADGQYVLTTAGKQAVLSLKVDV